MSTTRFSSRPDHRRAVRVLLAMTGVYAGTVERDEARGWDARNDRARLDAFRTAIRVVLDLFGDDADALDAAIDAAPVDRPRSEWYTDGGYHYSQAVVEHLQSVGLVDLSARTGPRTWFDLLDEVSRDDAATVGCPVCGAVAGEGCRGTGLGDGHVHMGRYERYLLSPIDLETGR